MPLAQVNTALQPSSRLVCPGEFSESGSRPYDETLRLWAQYCVNGQLSGSISSAKDEILRLRAQNDRLWSRWRSNPTNLPGRRTQPAGEGSRPQQPRRFEASIPSTHVIPTQEGSRRSSHRASGLPPTLHLSRTELTGPASTTTGERCVPPGLTAFSNRCGLKRDLSTSVEMTPGSGGGVRGTGWSRSKQDDEILPSSE